ncbi:hypothetical protein [Amycolatopsis sp. NPDC102389]|uniref:hypothetical protein n=1 Tax=Amycolatopsis sp. NPDC102389 TaxID=3363941 RepID=UPI00380509BA
MRDRLPDPITQLAATYNAIACRREASPAPHIQDIGRHWTTVKRQKSHPDFTASAFHGHDQRVEILAPAPHRRISGTRQRLSLPLTPTVLLGNGERTLRRRLTFDRGHHQAADAGPIINTTELTTEGNAPLPLDRLLLHRPVSSLRLQRPLKLIGAKEPASRRNHFR